MKSVASILLLFVLCIACNNDKETASTPASENEIDAARNFIRAALDGKWQEARNYMIQDSVNNQLLDTFEERYQKSMSSEDKRGYREANITTYDPRKLSDSVIIVNYSNTYMNKKDSLKVVQVNGFWLIDLKYSYFPSLQ